MELWWNPWLINVLQPSAWAICHALVLTALVRRVQLVLLYPWFAAFMLAQCGVVISTTAVWDAVAQGLWLILVPLKIGVWLEIIRELTHYDARLERGGIALTGFSIGAFVVALFAMRWHPWAGEIWPAWIIAVRVAVDVILMFATVYAVLYFSFTHYVVSRPPAVAHAWIFAAFMAASLFKAVPVTDAGTWWMLHGLARIWQCGCLIAWRGAILTPKFVVADQAALRSG